MKALFSLPHWNHPYLLISHARNMGHGFMHAHGSLPQCSHCGPAGVCVISLEPQVRRKEGVLSPSPDCLHSQEAAHEPSLCSEPYPCMGTLWASSLISLLCAQAWTPARKREHCAVDTHSHGDPSMSMGDYQALKREHRVERELAAGGGRRVEEQEDTEGREDGHLQTGKSFLHG